MTGEASPDEWRGDALQDLNEQTTISNPLSNLGTTAVAIDYGIDL